MMKWRRDKKKKKKQTKENSADAEKWHKSADTKKKERGKDGKHHKHMKGSTTTGEKKKKQHNHRPVKQMQSPPVENLGDIVLVKDMNKKQKMAEAGSKEIKMELSKEPMKEWKLPAIPGPAYRSVKRLSNEAMMMVEVKKSQEFVELKMSPSAATTPVGQMKTPVKPEVKSKNFEVPAILGLTRKEEELVGAGDAKQKEKKKTVERLDVMTPSRKAKKVKRREEKEERSKDQEDLTRKERAKEETKELTFEEKKKKWKGYLEDMLAGPGRALRVMDREWSKVRSYLPVAATRQAFDFHARDNRFEDIVCIDQTRVVVRDRGSYLHASWVELENKRKMILAQLPLSHTASHFWQMILETRAQVILLLLTRYEYSQFSAAATFPQQQDFLHFEDRHIRVGEMRRVKVAGSHWTLSVLAITNGDQKRYVHLHHYSAWSHGQGLRDHVDLLRIQSALRKYKEELPQVVMSLSGCGRAGTYAAFELAHAQLHSDTVKELRVANAIHKVKDGRMHAVQRESQLKSIHLALLEHVLNNGFGRNFSRKNKEAWEILLKTSKNENDQRAKSDQ